MQYQQCGLHYQQLNLIAWLIDNVTTWVKLNGEPKVELLSNCTKVLPLIRTPLWFWNNKNK